MYTRDKRTEYFAEPDSNDLEFTRASFRSVFAVIALSALAGLFNFLMAESDIERHLGSGLQRAEVASPRPAFERNNVW